MDGMIPLDLPGLPERPLRPYDVIGTLEHPDGEEMPVPIACPLGVVGVHNAKLSQWRLSLLAPCASVALGVAEVLLPEAAGARWVIEPATPGAELAVRSAASPTPVG